MALAMGLFSTPRRRIVAAAGPPVLSLVAASVLFACGSADDNTQAAKPDPFATPGLLSDKQVRSAAKGSPERAFLAWWQAIQYRDAVTAYSLATPSARAGLSKEMLSTEAADAAAGFAARPEFAGSTVSGNTVVLRTRLTFFSAGKKSAVVPMAFPMAKRGHWLVNDLTYLRQQASAGGQRTPKAARKPKPKPKTATQTTTGAQPTNTATSP